MFDSFSNRVGVSQAGRFAETYDPMNGADNGGVVVNEGGSGGGSSSFGGIASYQVCACCARFHGATSDGGGGGSLNYLNSDDRGGFGSNDKPSLSPGDAGTQITRSNTSWSTGLGQAATVTFAFRLSAPATMPSDTATFTQFGAQQITATLQSLSAWSEVANITFVRISEAGSDYSNNATILFGNYATGQSGAAAFAYLPGGMPGATGANQVQGDVWVNSTPTTNTAPLLYNYGTQTLLHEIGHAIGLSHPADYNASAGVTITYGEHATYYEDSRQYTVMSYFSETVTGGNFGGGRYASSPLMDDIAAAQRLYGVNTSTRTGNNTYGFNSNAGQPWFSATSSSSPLIFCVWDAGGTDTFDFSGYTQAQVIDLRQGAFSNVGGLIGNVSIAIGAVIENVIGGSGADTIRGNSGANVIRGGGGADVIDGGLGSDTVVFTGARADYTITWNGQIGTVTATGQAAVTITNVEFLQFSDQTIAAAPTGGLTVGGDITSETINGSALGDTIGGLGGADTLNGLNGDDYLDGGSGNDTLNGGDGNDTLVGGLGNDTLNGGAGSDTADYSGATSAVTVDLTQGLAGGGGGSDTLVSIENVTGTAQADTIIGDGANNILRGGGGVDTLSGGGGDDQLFAGAPGQSGGAPDVLKGGTIANATRATAVSLTGTFDLMARSGVFNATTTPHSTVIATTHGGVEYYSFTVSGSNTAVVFDIDGATFDTTLRLFDSDGIELTSNDDGTGDPEGGVTGEGTDSRLTYSFVGPGTYYIQVAQWTSNLGGNAFTSAAPPAGESYTMHISLAGQAVQPITQSGSTLNGDAGADILTGGVGKDTLNGGADNDTLNGGAENDTLNGGDGTDTAVYSGLRSAYTITTSGGVTTITGPDGTDTVTNVERLQFSDGLFDIAGAPIQDTGPIQGTATADTLNGTTGADTINGLGGDDTINGLTGNDTIDGGDGVDTAVFSGTIAQSTVATNAGTTTVTGPDGTDTLTNVEYLRFSDGTLIVGAGGGQLFNGTAGNDVLTGTTFADDIRGGAGDDILIGGIGADVLNGGDGIDTASYSSSSERVVVNLTMGSAVGGDAQGDVLSGIENLTGSANSLDILTGNAGANVLSGLAGSDELYGLAGDDVLLGGSGDDILFGGAGADTLNGGDGVDTADYQSSIERVAVNLTTGTGLGGDAHGDVLSGVENIIGTNNSMGDILTGDANANTLNGMGGDDELRGLAGNDLLQGANGDDKLFGDLGDDTLEGGLGNDILVGGAGADVLNGGDGVDTADYSASSDRISVNLTSGTGLGGDAHGDVLSAIENLIGTNSTAKDFLTGNQNANVLSGLLGDDELNGMDGDDTLIGGAGADILIGGAGSDTADYSGSIDRVAVNLTTGVGLGGDAHGDVLSGMENLIGTNNAASDFLTGDANANIISGLDGDDELRGMAGNDTLLGGAGADRLFGDAGVDVLNGGAGDDILAGGAGADTLIGDAGMDTADYSASSERIAVNLSAGTALGGDAHLDVLSGIENLTGTNSSATDFLTGDANANILSGLAGNDELRGMAGDDTLLGGAGDDLLVGGAGADVLNGGDGVDTADYSASSDRISVNLTSGIGLGGDAQGDVLSAIENLIGTNNTAKDFLTGNGNANILSGLLGDDELNGMAGDDVLIGGAGADILIGGDGVDTADYSTSADRIAVNLSAGTALGGDAHLDVLSGIENLIGTNSSATDFLTGDANANVLSGLAGNDQLNGMGGDDILNGGAGDDVVDGGQGNDTFILRGVASDYTITVISGGYRIVDAVGGRDGTDTLTGVETLRFGDGSTFSLTPPAAPQPSSEGKGFSADAWVGDTGPLVLPTNDDRIDLSYATETPMTQPVSGDDFILSSKFEAEPQVLPSVHDDFSGWSKFGYEPQVRPLGDEVSDWFLGLGGHGKGQPDMWMLHKADDTLTPLSDSLDGAVGRHDPWS